jgi:hypothetical protein
MSGIKVILSAIFGMAAKTVPQGNWWKGLLIAAAGGALPFLLEPESIAKNPKHVLTLAGAGALTAVVAWIAKSPRQ